MKTKLFAIAFICTVIASCTKTIYVPVESVRTEHITNHTRDSIFTKDSIWIKEKGDSLWYERYTYIYVDKIKIDTFIKIDSIPYPYEVQVPGKDVHYVTGFENFQIWCGRILLLLAIGYFGIRYFKR